MCGCVAVEQASMTLVTLAVTIAGLLVEDISEALSETIGVPHKELFKSFGIQYCGLRRFRRTVMIRRSAGIRSVLLRFRNGRRTQSGFWAESKPGARER